MDKKVSVIVPVYNGELFIERCINSITAQSYADIEIIIVDDGSTDQTYALCTELSQKDDRIRLLHQDNAGVVMARKHGVEQAGSEFLLFTDADDWIEPHMIEALLDQIGDADMISSGVYQEKYPGWVSVCHDFYDEGLYLLRDTSKSLIDKMIYDCNAKILHPLTPWLWNKLMKTELVKRIYEHMDDSVFYGEDAMFVYSYALMAQSVVITHMPYYHYCYNENSVCRKTHPDILANINKVYLEMKRIFAEYGAAESLYGQLQAWITFLVKDALNNKLGFFESGNIPDFLLDARQLGDAKKIILYGAGRMGEDFANQLKKLGCEVVLWVDGNYQYWQSIGCDIKSPMEVQNCQYDKILVAIASQHVKREIINLLMDMGISKEDIILPNTIVF